MQLFSGRSGHFGIPTPTEPKEFNLHPGKRKTEQAEHIEEKHTFHANPLPTKILEQPVVMLMFLYFIWWMLVSLMRNTILCTLSVFNVDHFSRVRFS